LNAFADENAAECVRVFRIPIENQIALAAKEAVVRVGEIPRDLCHPPAVGMGCDTRDLHCAAGDIDEEQDIVCHQSLDPCVSPLSILKRHAQNEINDRLHVARPTGASTMVKVPL
jgi:hypothetical protein